MKKINSLGVCLCVVLLAGCAGAPSPTFKKPPANSPSDDASMRLVEAASSVSNSLDELAKIEAASTPPGVNGKPLPDAQSYALQSKASVDWSGPIEPLLERIAKISGYHVRVLGKAPAIPVLVSLSAKNITLSDMLRNAALQAGKKADILVYANSHVIELRYAKT